MLGTDTILDDEATAELDYPTVLAPEERRQQPRYPTPAWPVLRQAPEAVEGTAFRLMGLLRDIGLGGIRVASREVPALGDDVLVTLVAPAQAGRAEAWIPVRVRMVWIGPAADGRGFESGYEFLEQTPEIRERVTAVVHGLAAGPAAG